MSPNIDHEQPCRAIRKKPVSFIALSLFFCRTFLPSLPFYSRAAALIATCQVNLDTLEPQQLAQVKKQLEEELEHLTSSFAQLHGAHNKFKECLRCVQSRAADSKGTPNAPKQSQRGRAGGEGSKETGANEKKKTNAKIGGVNRFESSLGPVDQLSLCERRVDEHRHGLGGRGHWVLDRKGQPDVVCPFGWKRGSNNRQKLKSAETFYDLKIKEIGNNLKELEAIVQRKQMNVRTIEEGMFAKSHETIYSH